MPLDRRQYDCPDCHVSLLS
nr:hypothetical protein [Oxynema sp. CENA135]